MSGVRIASIPRKVTKRNMEYMLDGYHYEGMEEALKKYVDDRCAEQCCWVYEQRTAYKGYSEPPDILQIVGKVITYDDESFMVEISRPDWFDILPSPRVSISYVGERDPETMTIRVKKVISLHVGNLNI